jgi:tRNA threonylcarbamoyladenosine biosynthesis protein TsaB
MSLLLHLETSSEICSIALSNNGELIDIFEAKEKNIHSEKLTLFVSEIFKNNNLEIKSLSAVSVSSGPGSYTGLRIGVAVAKGICFGLEIPLIAVNTLDSLAYAAKKQKEFGFYIPLIDAKNKETYKAVYDKNLNILEPYDIKPFDLNDFEKYLNEDVCFVVEKSSKLELNDDIKSISVNQSAKNIFELASDKFEKEEFENISNFEPLYLRDFIAKKFSRKIKDVLNNK